MLLEEAKPTRRKEAGPSQTDTLSHAPPMFVDREVDFES